MRFYVIIFQGGLESDPLGVGIHDALEWSLLCGMKSSMRPGKMAQCLGALVAVPEGPGSTSSTHMVAHSHLLL